jgi:ATP-binding cassette subfamily F protein uup
MLTGEVQPDEGSVAHGTNLKVAVFDQARAQLDPEMTLWESLTGDPVMRVSGKADQVMVRGEPRHVVAYLKDFLFDDAQARAPIKSLSGGEKARLLLAKLMAQDANLLVLDEPTNDLDIETLDLLQEILDDFAGTVLLVSHDRDFLDRVATMTVAMETRGTATVYAGGWSDYQAQKALAPAAAPVSAAEPAAAARPRSAPAPAARKSALTFTQKHRLEALPGLIDKLTAEVARLEAVLSDAGLFAADPARFAKASAALVAQQQALARAEDEWLDLAARAES